MRVRALVRFLPNISVEQYRVKIGTFSGSFRRKFKSICDIRNNSSLAKILLLIVTASLLSQFSVKNITNFQARSYNGNGVSLAHWNKGNSHYSNKINEIKNLINVHKPKILGISEANLFRSQDINQCQIDDYNLHVGPSAGRPGKEASRVIVYSHKNLVAKPRLDLSDPDFHSIWLEVGLPKQKKFLVCQAYREWQQPGVENSLSIDEQLARWRIFLSQWERALDSGMECIVMGDLNINHLNWQSDVSRSNQTTKLRPLINELFTRIIPQCVSQLVTVATRHFPGQTSTGLDHCYSNVPDKICQIQTHCWGGSDHQLVVAVRRSRAIKSSPSYIRKRSYKSFNKDQFLTAVKATSFLSIYLSDDVDEAVAILTMKLTELMQRFCPMKTIQIRKNYAPWLSKHMKCCLLERDKLQKRAIDSKDPNDFRQYKKVRNRITSQLRLDERAWQAKKLNEVEGSSAGSWKAVKGILGWSSSGPPTKLFHNGLMQTKSLQIANCQNNFFIEKVKKIKRELPKSAMDPLHLLRKLMRNRTCSFKFKPVQPEKVEEMISQLSNSSSFGLDNIDTYCIKLAKKELLPALTHIVNLSISQNKYPTAWKKTKIVPLLKGSADPLNPKSYRPVAIVPVLSKVLEKVIFGQLSEYLRQNRILHPSHHAYRGGHNTTTALTSMYDKWTQAADAGLATGIIILDMSAAFDVVDPKLLLQKLKLFGFDESSVNWMQSYLTNREQCVGINGILSSLEKVDCGVPQGSILGPCLYTLYTCELPEVIREPETVQSEVWPPYQVGGDEEGMVSVYADDTVVTITAKNPIELTEMLERKYKKVSEWMLSQGLKLNDDKSHLMVVTAGLSREGLQAVQNVELRTGKEIIKPSSSEKFLGGFVSSNLKWSEHILTNQENLCLSLSRRVNAMKQLSRVASFKTRRLFANGLFMGKLSYLISLWGGTSKDNLKALQVIQNKAARFVTRDWNNSTVQNLSALGWLSVNQMIFYHTVLLMFKLKRSRAVGGPPAPTYLLNMFNWEYNYETRQAEAGVVKPLGVPRLDVSKQSFRYRAAEMYNKMPRELTSYDSVNMFKTAVKSWIIDNIPVRP